MAVPPIDEKERWKKNKKAELEKKIKELEEKLTRLSTQLDSKPVETKPSIIRSPKVLPKGFNESRTERTRRLERENELKKYESDYLKRLEKEQREQHKIYVIGSSPIGDDPINTVREVANAKEHAEKQAGLLKTTESGSVWNEDNAEYERVIPKQSIHEFDNMKYCECSCHPEKRDCMNCYDHPEHLEGKRVRQPKTIAGYDEEKIMELIEQDKAKKRKKSWKDILFR